MSAAQPEQAPPAPNGPVSPYRISRTVLLFAALTGSLYCSGITAPSEGRPTSITVISGNGQAGTVGRPLSDSLVVRLTDSKDRPVQGQRVQFRVVTGGNAALLLPETVETNNDGVARSQWVLGGVAGEQQVKASVVTGGSLTASFTATAGAEGPDTIFAVAGQDQTGVVNGKLTDSLVVEVADAYGNPLAGQAVSWQITSGQVSASTTLTDVLGRAAVARILGPNSGSQTTRATSSSLPGQEVVFRHTAISGNAVDLIRVSPDNQTAPAGARLADSLVVQALDGDGNGVPNQTITWVPSIGSSVSTTVSVTDAEGKAFTFWTLSNRAGGNTLTAAGFGNSVQYHATGVSADPDSLRALSPTTFTAAAGQPVPAAQRPSVRVSDAQGGPVPGVSVTFTVTSGGGTVSDANGSGTSVAIATDADGSATVTSWTLGQSLGSNTVTATASRSGGGGSLEGSPVSFTATAGAGSATRLNFGQQPSSVSTGSTISPAVTVRIEDPSGNLVTNSSVTVTLAFGNNPGSASLGGTVSASAVNGVVTFATLSINRPGVGYTLVANDGAGGLTPATSAPFNITGGSSSLSITSHTPDPTLVGQPYSVGFQVTSALGTPNGSVTVSDGQANCSGNLSGGTGSCSLTSTTAGVRNLTATYAGSGGIPGSSTTAPVTHTVNPAGTTMSITADSPDPSDPAQSVRVQWVLEVTAPGSGTPTGIVTVSDGTAGSCTAPAATGFCDLAMTTAGVRTLTSSYPGDGNFLATTDTEPHTVSSSSSTLRLFFTVQPSRVDRGEVIEPHVQVAIRDGNNQVVTQANNPVTLVLGNNLLGLASLNGTRTRTPVNGVIEFDDLTVTGLTQFKKLTLIASSPGLESVESHEFDAR